MNATTLTAEEERAGLPAPQALLRRSGFAAAAPLFSADLAGCAGPADANRVVSSHGRRLWSEAVRQAEGETDDRPLYWARLTLAARLRAWRPDFDLDDAGREALLRRLEHASRGHDDLVFPPDDRLLRVIVTGFDPSGLDDDPRRSDPSGVAALALHDAGFAVGDHTAVVRTAIFPARWRDFTDGMVEEVLRPHFTSAAVPADAVVAVSQGRSGRFEVVAHNGAWRGGGADNEGRTEEGPVPVPSPAEPADGAWVPPQWCPSTLPRATVAATVAGRFPVLDATEVVEVPADSGADSVTRPEGPTPGSSARRGGGGDFLGNEAAYRISLLRDTAGRTVPAGQIRTPALTLADSDPAAVTDEAFARDRADIVEELRAIITAAVARDL